VKGSYEVSFSTMTRLMPLCLAGKAVIADMELQGDITKTGSFLVARHQFTKHNVR
jgi:hypothetical protein